MSTKRSLPRGIRRQKSGKYQARVTFESKQYGLGTFNTLQDAKARLAQAEADKSRGQFIPPRIKQEQDTRRAQAVAQQQDRQATPLDVVAAEWVEWLQRNGRKEGTTYTYDRLLKSHFLPVFGDRGVAAITVDDINDWHSGLVQQRGTGVANKVYQTVARMFTYATGKAQGQARSFIPYRADSPCDIPEAGQQPKNRRRLQVATAEDITALADAMPSRDRLMILLAGYNALRLGEVLGLRRGHVVTVQGTDGNPLVELHIQEQVQARGSGVRVEAPKSQAGVRVIPVHAVIVDDVLKHLEHNVAPGADALLFPRAQTDNRAHNPNTVGKRFRKAVDAYCATDETVRARVEGFQFHDLRHTALTRLGQAGATLADLMKFAGHADVASVLVYQHSERSRLAELTGH